MLRKLIILTVALSLNGLSAYGQEAFPFLGEITTAQVNVRAGQSVSFEQVDNLNKGDKVVVTAKEFSWYKIKLSPQAECFVNSKYIQRQNGDVGIVTVDHLNLRAARNEKANVLGRAHKDTVVKIKGESDGWTQIEPPEGAYGWVKDKFVIFSSKEIPSPTIITLSGQQKVNVPRDIAAGEEEVELVKEERAVQDEGLFTAVGYVEDVGRLPSDKNIHYKLVVDNKTVFYLECPRAMADYLVNYKAKVYGTLKNDPKKTYPYSVIVVKKMNLVL